MKTSILLTVTLPPQELLDRLLAFGNEWRESKFPAAIRERGVYGSKVVATVEGFIMSIERGGREPKFELRGAIAMSGSETIVTGKVQLTLAVRIWYAIWAFISISALTGTMIADVNTNQNNSIPAFIAVALLQTVAWFSLNASRKRATRDFVGLLQHAALQSPIVSSK